jgi:hypothetical protein
LSSLAIPDPVGTEESLAVPLFTVVLTDTVEPLPPAPHPTMVAATSRARYGDAVRMGGLLMKMDGCIAERLPGHAALRKAYRVAMCLN